ncbi:MAG: FAD-binding protein [Burkholderiaceae bacterium]
MTEALTNWARNFSFSAREVLHPASVEEVQWAVRDRDRVKVLGSRHSFNDIGDSEHTLLLLDSLPAQISLDPETSTVRAAAGVTFGALGAFLHERGFAIPNLASLPHISLAGAFATGTHGSGTTNRVLAASVAALELVLADGRLVSFARAIDPDIFDGVVVGLGALGVVVSVTLDVVPAFEVRQDVYLNLSFDAALAQFDEIMDSAYSVSLFTDWQRAAFDTVWCKRRVGDPAPHGRLMTLFGAHLATTHQHPIPGLDAAHCTEQGLLPGPAHERLPHFRLEFQPSHGDELQTEYLLPRQHAVAAFNALRPLQPDIARLVLVNEIRTVAKDTLWMSPACGRDSVAFHFTWKPDVSAARRLLAQLEAALAPFEPRPHWGKLFTMPPAGVQSRYAHLADFQGLACSLDPNGKFRNRFLDTFVLK